MKNQIQNFMGIFEELAEQEDPIKSYENYLLMLPKLPFGMKIRQYEIFHKRELSEIINKQIVHLSRIYKINEKNSYMHFEYQSIKGNKNEEGFFCILPGEKPFFSRITAIATSEFWKMIVKKIVKDLYPYAMPVYFRQDEIENALNNYEKGLGLNYRIRISDVTAKEERDNRNKSKIIKYDTQRWWTNLPISEVFGQAKERGQWFTAIRYVIQKRISNSERFFSIGSGSINKYGELNFDSSYDNVRNFLLNELENNASKRLSKFEDKSLRERNYRPANPIEISYNFEIFDEVKEIHRFGQVILDYPKSTKVIYHSNPYYHSSVADFVDGSSFDIWILSLNKILIIPQAKSSVQAFERLVGHISSKFYEGDVDEYRE